MTSTTIKGGYGNAATGPTPPVGWLRHSHWDGVLIGLALLHGLALIWWPSVALIALGLWWNANTISHNFIHLPFFRMPALNRAFSIYLSLILGIPQSLWRARHLAHHADKPPRLKWSGLLVAECAAILILWSVLLVLASKFFLTTCLPGYLLGLALCQLHGYFEHRQGTISHYGWFYNVLFFNDGYHREHHESPGRHWRHLRQSPSLEGTVSPWPACVRWLDFLNLDSLEKLVLESPTLQTLVLASHEKAFRKLLPELRQCQDIVVVGGGLFPRTILILQKLLPQARLRVIEANQEHIDSARRVLSQPVEFKEGFWEPGSIGDSDLVIIPLAYQGDRERVYQAAGNSRLLVHDWVWRSRGRSTVISWFLLKRLNLVEPRNPEVI